MPLDPERLNATDNAMVWAKEFVNTIRTNPYIVINEGFMVGWFANAMETAKQHDRKRRVHSE